MSKTIVNKLLPINGFTLVEVVLVIVIMGILAAVSIPRFADIDDFRERAFADSTLASVRYFQKLAISTGCDVWVDFGVLGHQAGRPAEVYAGQHNTCNAPPEFTATEFSGGNSIPVADPSGGNINDYLGNPRMMIQAPSDYDIEDKQVFFDKLGRPHKATATSSRDYYTGLLTISLKRPDGTVYNQLQIEPATGFAKLIGPP